MAFKFANQGDKPLFTSNGIPFMFGTGDLTTLPDSDGEAIFIQEDEDTNIDGSDFGASVAIGFNRIVVGAPNYNTTTRAGAVFVYSLDGRFLQRIDGPNNGGEFGSMVKLANTRNNIPSNLNSAMPGHDFSDDLPESEHQDYEDLYQTLGEPKIIIGEPNWTSSSYNYYGQIHQRYLDNDFIGGGGQYRQAIRYGKNTSGYATANNLGRNFAAYDGYVLTNGMVRDTSPAFITNKFNVTSLQMYTYANVSGGGGSAISAEVFPPPYPGIAGDGLSGNGVIAQDRYGGGFGFAEAWEEELGFGGNQCGMAIGYNRIYVGAPFRTGGGAVFVYDMAGTYLHMIKPQSTNQITPSLFGTEICLHAGRIIVAAPGTAAPSKANSANRGAFYIFDLEGRELRAVRPPARYDSNSPFQGIGFGWRGQNAYNLTTPKGNNLAAGCGRIAIVGVRPHSTAENLDGYKALVHIYNIDGDYLTTYERPAGFNSADAGVSVALGSGRLVIADFKKSGDLDGTSVRMGRISIHKTPDVMTVFEYRDRKLGRA